MDRVFILVIQLKLEVNRKYSERPTFTLVATTGAHIDFFLPPIFIVWRQQKIGKIVSRIISMRFP